MKKILFLFLGLVAFGFIFSRYQARIQETIIVTSKDLFNAQPQQYYGVTVDMSQILPGSQNYVVNSSGEDFIDIAAKLGINTFRITNITSIKQGTNTPFFTHPQWSEVLQKMQSKGMSAVILVEGNSSDRFFHDTTMRDYYVNFVKNYIVAPDVCSFSNVLAIDIANEPALNKNNLEKMTEASVLVKAACPKTKITIGSWRTDSGERDGSGGIIYNWHDPKEVRQINDIVDMISVHIYGFDKLQENKTYPDPYILTTGYLKEIKKYTTKPIFIEEFGAGNGSTLTDQNTMGSPEIQKAAYEGVLQAMFDFRNKGVLGATGYLLYPRSKGIDSWSISTDNANNLLPAAFTFSKYSKNKIGL